MEEPERNEPLVDKEAPEAETDSASAQDQDEEDETPGPNQEEDLESAQEEEVESEQEEEEEINNNQSSTRLNAATIAAGSIQGDSHGPSFVFVNPNALEIPGDGSILANPTLEQIAAVAGETSDGQDTMQDVLGPGAIWEPAENDVLSGRGALVNAHMGNKRFRAICFSRKSAFDLANHAAKKRIATEIWATMVSTYGSRFLKKQQKNGPWYELKAKKAILKAAQVIRDYKRPDRVVQREILNAGSKKRNRATATPMDDVPLLPPVTEPIMDNPDGVMENDVLCGRGAFVNGHSGNQQLRKMAHDRKFAFDAGNYTTKHNLASEIISIIGKMNPPGRFLKKNEHGEWLEIEAEDAIHKTCQVMRDLDREDRQDRVERRRVRTKRKKAILSDQLTLLDTQVSNADEKAKEVKQVVSKTIEKLEKVLTEDEERERGLLEHQKEMVDDAVAPPIGLPGPSSADGESIVAAAGLVLPSSSPEEDIPVEFV